MKQDMKEHMEAYAVRAASIKDMCKNEEQTKISLINPYIELIGYDVRDPRHVLVEHRADFHTGREKVDYVILKDGEPWLAIEAKSATQLLGCDAPTKQVQRYAVSLDVKFAAYTNGLVWRWFKKGAGSNQLEEKPFLEHDVTKPEDRDVPWLAAIHNAHWDREKINSIADEEHLQSDFTNWFRDYQKNPSDKFLKLILNDTGHSATKKMLKSARVAWKRVVRNSEAAQLNEASRRLRGEAGDQSEPQDARKRETTKTLIIKGDASSKKLKAFRWRYGLDGVWNYEKNGGEAQRAVAKHYFDTAYDFGHLQHLLKKLNTRYVSDGLSLETAKLLETGEEIPRYFHRIGTDPDIVIRDHLNMPGRIAWFTRLMRAAPDFEIETDQGEGNNDVDQAEWPWVSVATLVKPSINEDE